MRRVVLISMGFFAAILSGCGSTSSGVTTATVAVTLSPTSATLNPNDTAMFTATVTPSDANSAITWTLSGSGCTGNACGTLSSTTSNPVTYTAPAVAPSPNIVTVTATSVADPTKSAAAAVTINSQPIISVVVSPANLTVVVGSSAQNFTATVVNSTDQTVAWALAGTGCSGATCGTLSSTTSNPVSYTPPAAAVVPGPVTLTATADADTTKSAVATINVLTSSNALLIGSYAYQLQGFTTAGLPVGIAGSFTSDGNGNITVGTQDVNINGSVNTFTNTTGTYSVSTNLQGTFTLTSVPGAPVFSFITNATGVRGDLIEFDAGGNLVSGVFAQQDTSSFALGSLAGNFAFHAEGSSLTTGRSGAVGRFNLGPTGILSGGTGDTASTSGTILSNAPLSGAFTAPDTTGRGTAQLIFTGGSTFNLAYYAVNATQIFLLDIDPAASGNPLVAGQALSQTLGLDNTSLNSPSVFWVTGLSTLAPAPSVAIGTFTGSSTALTLAGALDANDGGTNTHVFTATGTFTNISPSTGRGTLTLLNGATTVLSAVFYLTQAGTGFLLENSVVGNEARAGQLIPQTGGPFGNGSLAGNFIATGGGSATSDIPNVAGFLVVDNSSATFSITSDIAALSGNQQAATGAGSYANVLTNGRANTVIPSAFFNSGNGIIFIASPTEFVVIGDDTNAHSGVTIVTQQ
jgi:hypothetical protein